MTYSGLLGDLNDNEFRAYLNNVETNLTYLQDTPLEEIDYLQYAEAKAVMLHSQANDIEIDYIQTLSELYRKLFTPHSMNLLNRRFLAATGLYEQLEIGTMERHPDPFQTTALIDGIINQVDTVGEIESSQDKWVLWDMFCTGIAEGRTLDQIITQTYEKDEHFRQVDLTSIFENWLSSLTKTNEHLTLQPATEQVWGLIMSLPEIFGKKRENEPLTITEQLTLIAFSQSQVAGYKKLVRPDAVVIAFNNQHQMWHIHGIKHDHTKIYVTLGPLGDLTVLNNILKSIENPDVVYKLDEPSLNIRIKQQGQKTSVFK